MAGFHPYAHFADVIGPTVRKEHPVEEVVLKFSPQSAPYVLTKPLHSSQTLKKEYKNGAVSFSYRLRFNRELLSLIMSFGADVEVVAPESLKDRLRELLQQMLGKY